MENLNMEDMEGGTTDHIAYSDIKGNLIWKSVTFRKRLKTDRFFIAKWVFSQ